MSDLDRFIHGIQQLRFAMKSADMDAADVSIRISTDDGRRLEHMLNQSEQFISVANVKEPVGHSQHVTVAGFKVWWLA